MLEPIQLRIGPSWPLVARLPGAMTFSESNVRRDTEGKFSEKVGTAPELVLEAPTAHWTDADAQQLLALPDDEHDANDMFRYFAIWSDRAKRRGKLGKIARHQIAEDWQHPRLPGPRHGGTGQLAAGLPWSPAAREILLSGEDTSNRLRLEHVMPQRLIEKRLFGAYEAGEIASPDDMLAHLRAAHIGPRFAVITKEEDDLITSAGFRDKLPADGNPLGRYDCLPCSINEFASPMSDERYLPLFKMKYARWATTTPPGLGLSERTSTAIQ